MSLSVTRKDGETWRQCVERYSSKYGLQAECLEIFDQEVAGGEDEGRAAWSALYEWDCTDFTNREEK